MYYVKLKEANQICTDLTITQSINAESACDRNNKSMYSCFHESKKFLSCLMYWEEKNRRYWKCIFLKLLLNFFNQVYSNTRVPTQVKTSQHESTRIWHESTRINTSLTRVNKNQHESDTSQHESKTSQNESDISQHKSKSVLDELTWVITSPTLV